MQNKNTTDSSLARLCCLFSLENMNTRNKYEFFRKNARHPIDKYDFIRIIGIEYGAIRISHKAEVINHDVGRIRKASRIRGDI